MKCWSCGTEEKEPAFGKLPFRSTCEKCGASLHCCCNCKYYKVGMPNDCLIPGTEFIADRTKANFCEDFKLLGKGIIATGDVKKAAQRLFGTDEEEAHDRDPKKRFNSLFQDDN